MIEKEIKLWLKDDVSLLTDNLLERNIEEYIRIQTEIEVLEAILR